MLRRVLFSLICLVAALGQQHFALSARSEEPARLAPESSVFYAELSQPEALLDRALAPSTLAILDKVEGWQKYLKSPEYTQAKFVTSLLESRLGATWEPALRQLIGGGLYVALDADGQSAVLIAKGRNAEMPAKLHDALKELVEADARNNGRESPIKSQDYKGVTGWTFGPNENHCILGDMLVISNKGEMLKGVIDRSQDSTAKGLAGVEAFQQARTQSQAGTTGWAWVAMDTVRKAPGMAKALSDRANNPLAELLVGGILDTLRHAPFATATLNVDDQQVRLAAQLPRDASKTAANRSWFFASETGQGAPAAVKLPQTIATISTFRDLAGLWAARDELFDEQTLAGFSQADTQLGLFFSGRDFGPEVLGELEPQVQFVVARQEFAPDQPTPTVKFPAMALVLKMKHPDEFATPLLVAYQKIVGLVNITGGQAGQPQLLLTSEEYKGATISKSTYLLEKKDARDKAPVNFNFSPSCARVGDYFIYASTTGILRQLADQLQSGSAPMPTADNSLVRLEAASLASILEDNRELLISQNMLTEGRTRAESEQSTDTILNLVRAFEGASLRLAPQAEGLVLEVAVKLQSAATP